jgi:hypothetical protein
MSNLHREHSRETCPMQIMHYIKSNSNFISRNVYYGPVQILTHSWSWALLEKLPLVSLLKNFAVFYGTRRFSTVFTRVFHWSLSWARLIQSISSHSISISSILILFTHIRLGLPSSLFPSGFSTNILMHSSSPHLCYMSYPSHPPWLDYSNYTWKRVEVMKLLIV